MAVSWTDNYGLTYGLNGTPTTSAAWIICNPTVEHSFTFIAIGGP